MIICVHSSEHPLQQWQPYNSNQASFHQKPQRYIFPLTYYSPSLGSSYTCGSSRLFLHMLPLRMCYHLAFQCFGSVLTSILFTQLTNETYFLFDFPSPYLLIPGYGSIINFICFNIPTISLWWLSLIHSLTNGLSFLLSLLPSLRLMEYGVLPSIRCKRLSTRPCHMPISITIQTLYILFILRDT